MSINPDQIPGRDSSIQTEFSGIKFIEGIGKDSFKAALFSLPALIAYQLDSGDAWHYCAVTMLASDQMFANPTDGTLGRCIDLAQISKWKVFDKTQHLQTHTRYKKDQILWFMHPGNPLPFRLKVRAVFKGFVYGLELTTGKVVYVAANSVHTMDSYKYHGVR